ncbi:MAG: pilus assembly protein [Planctomycetales bacterium]|nr:pilus assembly protein [Planctomycetales bacterium]
MPTASKSANANARRRTARRRSRRGTLTVEFALTSSVLFLFFMASIDFARVNLIRHTINNAAFEAARAGIIPGATASTCQTRAQAILAAGMVVGATIDVTPNTIEESTEVISVTVTAPLAPNQWVVSWFFPADATIVRTSTIVRETY